MRLKDKATIVTASPTGKRMVDVSRAPTAPQWAGCSRSRRSEVRRTLFGAMIGRLTVEEASALAP